MKLRPAWARSVLLVMAAFAGGAATSHFAKADTQAQNPYATLDQLARVLVLVENQYVEPTERSKLTEGAVRGLVAELDPHSAYLTPEEFSIFEGETAGKFGGVGVEVDFRDDAVTVIAPIEGSPAARAGVKSGDQIVAIDGKPVRGEHMDKLIGAMRGPPGSKVTMTVRRAGVAEPITFELVREEIHVQSVTGKRLVRDVAYVRVKQFQEGTHQELLRAAAAIRAQPGGELTGVILDLRNNPGGLVDEAEGVADEFLSSGVIYTTRHRGKIIDEIKAHAGGAFASLPVVALVNEYSASAAELLAGALQDNKRASIVGAQTFGKGSVQTIFDLPGGAGMRLTTARYYTPSGRSIQAEGIKPDLVIQSAQAGAVPALRERDLEGHLAAEGTAGGPTPPASAGPAAGNAPVLVDKHGQGAATVPAEVPVDPSKGSDFALAAAYDLLEKQLGAKRPAP